MQLYILGNAVAPFAHEEVGLLPGAVTTGIAEDTTAVVAVQQHHHIGILFYGATLAQVGKGWALVVAVLALAVQLR